jgi:hypothetical protein
MGKISRGQANSKTTKDMTTHLNQTLQCHLSKNQAMAAKMKKESTMPNAICKTIVSPQYFDLGIL